MMVFLAVVETGSFTLAAERLTIPKANVSRKVSRLERQLGVTLLQRSTRSQHLTEAGRIYLAHCKRIHEEMDLAQSVISEIRQQVSGDIKVGCSVAVGEYVLSPVLADFMKQYPQLNVQLSLTNRRVDLIEEGFDLLIRIGELEDSGLVAKKLGTASQRLFASPDYLTSTVNISTLEQLQQQNILLMSASSQLGKLTLTNSETELDKALIVKPKLLVDDFSVLKQTTLDGLGIGLIPDYMCKDELSNGSLVQVLPEWRRASTPFYALYPKHRIKIPKVKVFVDFIQNLFSKTLLSEE